MPSPASAAPPGAASPLLCGSGMDDVEFPRSAAYLCTPRRRAGALRIGASEESGRFPASDVSASGGARNSTRTTSVGVGRETARGVSRIFRGNPLAPFMLQSAADKASVANGKDASPDYTRGPGPLEELDSSIDTGSTGNVQGLKTHLWRLADLPAVPVGTLLMGVIAEIHSDDLLVHLPDGLVGWVPRAHAVPSLLDEASFRGSTDTGNRERRRASAKRCRKDSGASSTAATGGAEASSPVGTNIKSKNNAAGGEAQRETAASECAGPWLGAVAGGLDRRVVSLTACYFVGQVVQCVVIAEGGESGSRPQTRHRFGRGQECHTMVLSLRPSIFNAGLTVETVVPGMVLPAFLSSVEDHGYFFAVGIQGVSAFLPLSALQKSCHTFWPTGTKNCHTGACEASSFSTASPVPLTVLLHSFVSLRVDDVNAAAKVLLCSLPGTNIHGRASQSVTHRDTLCGRSCEEPHLALGNAVAWQAVKSGCLVEARVEEVYRWSDRAERKRTAKGGTVSAKVHRTGKNPSLSKGCVFDTNEEAGEGGIHDIAGVRVSCMGGNIIGTVLQPHFGHPLFPLEKSSVSGGLLRKRRSGPGTADIGQGTTEAANEPPGERQRDEGQGSDGLGNRHDCSSEIGDVSVHGSASGLYVRRRQRKRGFTSIEKADRSLPDETRYEDIEAQYSKACLSTRVTRVGSRVFARVTCVLLSSDVVHVYLSMLPHLMEWRPYQLPCSIPELLPGRCLLGKTAHVFSRFPGGPGLLSSHGESPLQRLPSLYTGASDGGEVRVLLQMKCDDGGEPSQRSIRGLHQRKRSPMCVQTADDPSCLRGVGDETMLAEIAGSERKDSSVGGIVLPHTKAECGRGSEGSTGTLKHEWQRGQQSCSWVLVRIPRGMMAAPTKECFSAAEGGKEGRNGKRRGGAADVYSEEIAFTSLAPGDMLWSARSKSTEVQSCFCRVLYFDRFAAEVVGGNAPRLLKDSVLLSPFDVLPGQTITVTVLRWRLPAESVRKVKRGGRRSRVHISTAPGVFVRLSPYLTTFVPLYQLTDTPMSSFLPHVAPGNSLKMRVLERVCCRSCTQLDRDARFAFFVEGARKRNIKCQFFPCSSNVSNLRDALNYLPDGRTCDSSVMGMGGGGGGRLVLTGKKCFLKDSHPLTLLSPSSAIDGTMNNPQAYYIHEGMIALGYVQKIFYKKGVTGADSWRRGENGGGERLPSITVGFYNGLIGRLLQDEVRRAIFEEGRTFELGTVVKVRVLGVDTKHRCLRVTMDTSREAVEAAVAATRRKEEKAALRLFTGGVIKKDRLTLLALTDEGALVAVEEKKDEDAAAYTSSIATASAKNMPTTVVGAQTCPAHFRHYMRPDRRVFGLGFVPKMHLSDGVRLAEELHGFLQVGEKLPLNAVVLSSASAVRPGTVLQMWEPTKTSVGEDHATSVKENTVQGSEGHSRGQLRELLDRVKRVLQQPSAAAQEELLHEEDQSYSVLRDVAILSCKPSLRVSATNGTFLRDSKAAEKLKLQLHPSPPTLWGYVRKIGPYGLLISFGAWQVTGLLPYSNMTEAFIEDENHLRQLYREGMTVRGCVVAVSDAAGENSEREASASLDVNVRSKAKVGKDLRFLVDIRLKRLSELQRHQQLEKGANTAASVGVQVLRGLFEQKTVVSMLKQSRVLQERLADTASGEYFSGSHNSGLIKATWASDAPCNRTPQSDNMTSLCLRPGELIWGRVVSQEFPHCVILELQAPLRELDNNTSSTERRLYPLDGLTGVVLEHQLPEGETIESIRQKARERPQLDPMPCIVLDFDQVTGIANVSCRRRLVNPLHVLHIAVEGATRGQSKNFVHYILLGGASVSLHDTQEGEDVGHTDHKDEEPEGTDGVRKLHVEVVTQEVDGAVNGEPAGATSETKAREPKEPKSCLPYVAAIPGKVVERIQSFCETRPVPWATVQVEGTAYSVLSADFNLVIHFSESKRLRQERLEALLSFARRVENGGDTAVPLRVMPDGNIMVYTPQIGKRAAQFDGHNAAADGLYVRLPLILFSTSCHNNTLVPIQPTAKTLQDAPEDGGWRVALSAVQRVFRLHSGTFNVPVLLVGGCWPMGQSRLEQQQKARNSGARFQRRRQANEPDNLSENPRSAVRYSKRLSLPQKRHLEVGLDDDVERTAAPGQIMRAKITHVGVCVAFARMQTPKQQLLLRLHAADALPPFSVETPLPAGGADDYACEQEHPRSASSEEDGTGADGAHAKRKETGPSNSVMYGVGETTFIRKEQQHYSEDSELPSWSPPVLLHPLKASAARSPSSGNPLKRLTRGMLVDVKVLRLREVKHFKKKPQSTSLSSTTKGVQQALCDQDGVPIYHQNEKREQENVTRRSGGSQWVADVELLGVIERRKNSASGPMSKASYVLVSNEVKGAQQKLLFERGLRGASTEKGADPRCESNTTRRILAWLYSPRWAVIETVGDHYLTIDCGVRTELLGRQLLLQQNCIKVPKTSSSTESSSSYEEYMDSGAAAAYVSGRRGRVCRLDATRDFRVLKDLRAGYAPGDMVCVRLLPMLTLDEAAFDEALRRRARAAKRCEGEKSNSDKKSNRQPVQRHTRSISSLTARYTVIPYTVTLATKALSNAAEADKQMFSDGSCCSATSVCKQTLPFCLINTSFGNMTDAVVAWALWRYTPGVVCWGVVHHMLPPPFAVAVQLCECVVKRRMSSSKNDPESVCERRPTRVSEDEDPPHTHKEELVLTSNRSACVHLPILAAVHLTEVTDGWPSDPVKHLQLRVGQLVKVRILPILEAQHAQQQLKHRKTRSRSGLPLEASLRTSIVEEPCKKRPRTTPDCARLVSFDQLKVGDYVSGHVVSTGDAGVFVAVSRSLTVRIRLQNLCGGEPSLFQTTQETHTCIPGLITGAQAQELYPVGKALRRIRVVELQPGSLRIEGSLKDESTAFPKRRLTFIEKERLASKRPKNESAADVASVCMGHNSNSTVSCGFEIGDVCEGRVKGIESFGVFVSLTISPKRRTRCLASARGGADALCHISDVGGSTEEERTARLGMLKLGDLVKARVIRRDKDTGRIWVSLDSSIFESGEDLEKENGDWQAETTACGDLAEYSERLRRSTSTSQNAVEGECIRKTEQSMIVKSRRDAFKSTDSACDVEDSSCIWSTAVSVPEDVSNDGCEGLEDLLARCDSAPMRSGHPDDHIAERKPLPSNACERVVDMCGDPSEKKNRLVKNIQRQMNEEEILLAEEESSYRAWIDDPRTPDDFEKLVLVSTNSAAVWIGYMAYYLKVGDLPRARQVAERAVLCINYREERERLDVWVAYLNMECVYGDAVETIFNRAIQYNDAKKIYYQMTFIYERAQKFEDALHACERCCARFPGSQKMWIRHLMLLYATVKDLSAAREVMLEALSRLPRRKHVPFAATCARLEYKFGSKERGQTYFEKLLAEHPKRTDLWSQYMDAHIAASTPPRCKRADVQSIRLLFSRAVSIQLKPRKMKFLFTRWLQFEKEHGTVEGQSLVRARAKDYIQAMEAKLVERQLS